MVSHWALKPELGIIYLSAKNWNQGKINYTNSPTLPKGWELGGSNQYVVERRGLKLECEAANLLEFTQSIWRTVN